MMILQFLWEMLSSRTAIGLYVLIVLALITWLVIAVLRADTSRVQVVAPENQGDGNKTGKRAAVRKRGRQARPSVRTGKADFSCWQRRMISCASIPRPRTIRP